MSLIQYIFKALKPKILCEDGVLLSFLNLSGALGVFGDNLTISCDKKDKYDIILANRFDRDLYYENLNHDGFFFFIKGSLHDNSDLRIHREDFEYIRYASFCIVKKGTHNICTPENNSNNSCVSTPFWQLPLAKQSEFFPIIYRNFGNHFNIVPYCEPFEIIDHPGIIANLCKEFNVKTYLELGVRSCPVPHLISNIVPTIVGVDINDVPNFSGTFHKMMTDDYFEMCKTKEKEGDEISFDMVFIDACHDYEQVKTDFINSLRYVKVGGTIILHDTYPAAEYMTESKYCSDSYKMVDYIRKCGLQMLNLPISPGLCIVKV
jgi:hypothetical protein